MLIQETLFGTEDKVQNSIDALRSFEPPEGYYLAFSGGKDSVVVKTLCDMAGVKYDAHYRVTSVDPPELVQFIKEFHPDVKREVPLDKEGKPITMWNLIPRKSLPPTRIVRYCCEALKEGGGDGRFTITGVRWAESVNRKKNQGLVTVYEGNGLADENLQKTDRGGVVLNNDNSESREVLESCYKHRKTVLNPIINWTDEDVWEFIRGYEIPYCKLYDEGLKRLGCIGCPMASVAEKEYEFNRWPKYKTHYLHAFERLLKVKANADWQTPEEVWDWWIYGKGKNKPLPGQIEMDL